MSIRREVAKLEATGRWRDNRKRCRACAIPAVAKAAREFAQLKSEGKTSLPWQAFFDFIARKKGYDATYYALMNHVKCCLRDVIGRYGDG